MTGVEVAKKPYSTPDHDDDDDEIGAAWNNFNDT